MRKRMHQWLPVVILLFVGACAADEMESSGATGAPPNNGYPGPGDPDGQGGGAGQHLPPEDEVESSYESPVATDRFVWIANPTSGRVAYIDAVTLEVHTTEAGNGPKYLAAVPDSDQDVALVINTLSQDATILRAGEGDLLESATVPVAQQNNAWSVSSSGRFAIAWTDARLVPNASAADGFQDVTVVDLKPGAEESFRLSVGYRPVAVRFSSDNKHAYAVTQDGISVIDLGAEGGPKSAGLVAMSSDPLEDPGTRDVSITPAGDYAFVRRDGSSAVTVIRLADGARQEVSFAGAVTDLDLAPSGTHAVAVVRELSQAVVLPVPGIFDDPTAQTIVQIQDAVVGSVAMAAASPVALLYSNASDQERVTRLGFAATPPEAQTIRLHAPVLAVFLSAGGEGSILLHKQIPADSQTGEPGSKAPGAFSVLNLSPTLPAKIVATQAPPVAVALHPAGEYAVVSESDPKTSVFGAYLIGMRNQRVDRYPLASPPTAVGMVQQAQRAFVAQEHPEGRITFIDLASGQARTLTGFELNSQVVGQ